MDELVFEITQEADGGFTAECLTEGIFTQADNWEELRSNVGEAVAAFYFDRPDPSPARPAAESLRAARRRVKGNKRG
jgi:hypothetical protein